MLNSKATDTVTIRKMILSRGPEAMERMLSKLKTSKDLFLSLSLTEWIPMDKEDEIIQAAADIIFPSDPKAIRRLGTEISKTNFSGIYKVFLRVSSVAFIAKRVSAVWHTFFDKGDAHCEGLTDSHVTFVVTEMPDLTPIHREYVHGYIYGIFELTRSKITEIIHDGSNPQAWKWEVKWVGNK